MSFLNQERVSNFLNERGFGKIDFFKKKITVQKKITLTQLGHVGT